MHCEKVVLAWFTGGNVCSRRWRRAAKKPGCDIIIARVLAVVTDTFKTRPLQVSGRAIPQVTQHAHDNSRRGQKVKFRPQQSEDESEIQTDNKTDYGWWVFHTVPLSTFDSCQEAFMRLLTPADYNWTVWHSPWLEEVSAHTSSSRSNAHLQSSGVNTRYWWRMEGIHELLSGRRTTEQMVTSCLHPAAGLIDHI